MSTLEGEWRLRVKCRFCGDRILVEDACRKCGLCHDDCTCDAFSPGGSQR